MIRRLPTALALVACLLLAVAGSAAARSHHRRHIHYLHADAVHIHKASGPRPSISRVSPMQVAVGQKLVVYGKNFRKGTGKNKVFFIKSGGGVVITKVKVATTTRLVVTVPGHVNDLLTLSGKTPVATKIQLRVLTDRFGSPTKLSKSPLIRPASGKTGGGTGGPACQQATTTDSDADGLTNQLEINTIHTDPCTADTDGDGLPDGYEYQGALDLNNTTLLGRDSQNALPCACKEPYPNPLDPTDAHADHDGDGLVQSEEYKLNKYVHGPKVGSLQYSDGKQRSRDVVAPNDPVLDYVDLVRYPSLNAGYLSDDERDADNDGLSNMDECCYRMTPGFWERKYNGSNGYPKETPYGVLDAGGTAGPVTFPAVSDTNPDSDGDGIIDGADDQDFDGLSNKFEVSRPYDWSVTYATRIHDGQIPDSLRVANGGPIPDAATGQNPWARVNPFNPCKPIASKTCQLYVPGGYYPAAEDITALDPETVGPAPAAPWLYDSNDHPWANGE